jgi:hypothetical protein
MAATHSRSGRKPSLAAYCSAGPGASVNTRSQAAWMASTGNVSADGRPPAMLRTPGFSATFRISLRIEGFIRVHRRAWVHTLMVAVSPPPDYAAPRAGPPLRRGRVDASGYGIVAIRSFYFRAGWALATMRIVNPLEACMSPSPDRVISIALTDEVWRAFTRVQPEPVSWLKSRILESIETSAPATAAPTKPGRA